MRSMGFIISPKLKKFMSIKNKHAIKLLRQYAKENGATVRSTSDLSPLEEWLFYKIVKCQCRRAKFTRMIDKDGNPLCGKCGLKI